MAKKVDSGTVVQSYAIHEYENYFGLGEHAYDVVGGAIEADELFDSVAAACDWLRGTGEVHSDGV